jgi:hypothetical protein
VLPGTEGGDPSRLRHARLDWAMYADPDHAAAGWTLPRSPGSLGPDAVVATRTTDGWVTSAGLGRAESATMASDGRVAWWTGFRRLATMDRSGTIRHYPAIAKPAPAPEGATWVGSSWMTLGVETDLWWIDPGTHVVRPVPSSAHLTQRFAAVRDAGGRIWVQGWDDDTNVWLAWTDDGGARWTERLMARHAYPGGIAVGRDGQVAAFGWTSPGSDHVVGRSIITRDGGGTWQPFARGAGPQWVHHEGTAGSAAAVTTLPDGTLYVVETIGAGDRGRLWRASGDWTDLHRVQVPGGLTWLQSNGDLIWGGRATRDVVISRDAGRTWHTVSPR